MLGIFQVCSLGTGHPYSFACIAACRHSFSGCAVLAWITSFLESNTSVWLAGNVHGKGKVLVDAAIFVCLRSKYKTIMKGTACGKIYPSGLEEDIEWLLRVKVIGMEMLNLIVLHIERLSITHGVKDSLSCLFYRHIEKPLAHFMDKGRLLDTLPVF